MQFVAAMNTKHNTRILLVDDAPSIHEDFRRILGAPSADPGLAASEQALFGTALPEDAGFELDSAWQGEEGLALVRAALAQERPYAMAFVDMHMPPGWDGIETVASLWEADPRLQVVICTAYSGHAWEDVLARLDVQDRLLIVKKPFDLIEVSQIARTLTAKWTLARRSEGQRRNLEAFAHAVSHDLRSPLAMIATFGELLQQELPAPSTRAAEYLRMIRAFAASSQDVVNGLLSLTDIARRPLQVEDVDLEALVAELGAELRAADPRRDAIIRVHPGLRVWADRRLMRVALRNLLENAWKFSSGRARTEIEVAREPDQDGQCVVAVRDNGCGFEMAQAGRLFREFQRLHASDYPGTGVGLVTVSRVLARHGGHAWAHSAPGQGSTFFLSLPKQPLLQSPTCSP